MIIQDINIIEQAIADTELAGLTLPQEIKDSINSKMKKFGFIDTANFLKLVIHKKDNHEKF